MFNLFKIGFLFWILFIIGFKQGECQAPNPNCGECETVANCTNTVCGANVQCKNFGDPINFCTCAENTSPVGTCLETCTNGAECPDTGVCFNTQCAPPCPDTPCTNGVCPFPLVCNANNLCTTLCPPPPPTTAAPTTTTSGPVTTPIPPTVRTCNQPNGEICANEPNARCFNFRCVCNPGFSDVNAVCIPDGTPGGRCDGSRRHCSEDSNAVPNNPGDPDCFCVCKPGTSRIGIYCITDGRVGGRCDGTNRNTCSLDKNAECMNPGSSNNMCVCKQGTRKVEGMCITDGSAGGFCVNGNSCPLDKNAQCVGLDPFRMCMCKPNTTQVEGMCIPDGSLRGLCDGPNKTQCTRDPNAFCAANWCICVPGSTPIDGMCRKDGMPGANCTIIGCPADMNAKCIDGVCVCGPGRTKVGGVCMEETRKGGNCYFGKCIGRYSICDPKSDVCVCKPGAVPIADLCVDPDYLQLASQPRRPPLIVKEKLKPVKAKHDGYGNHYDGHDHYDNHVPH